MECTVVLLSCLLLLLSCRPAAGASTTSPTAGCSASALPGRRLDPAVPEVTVLANVSAAAGGDCVDLCCARPECDLAALDGTVCLLLLCASQGCGTQPAGSEDGRQTLWAVTRDAPATAALHSGSPPAAWSTAPSPSPSPSPAAAEAAGADRPCRPAVSASCPASQRCVPLPARPEQGVCRCPAGQQMDERGQCSPPGAAAAHTTTAAPPSTASTLAPLVVTVKNRTITLPDDSAQLEAHVRPAPQPGESYRYEWSLLSGDWTPAAGEATMGDASQPQLDLDGLSAGVYVFRLEVTGRHARGVTFANVTVLPAPRVNRPPVAKVSMATQTLHLPNSKALLDGSASTDDLPSDQLTYHWEVTLAPLGWARQELPSSPTLQLENLTPGNYTVRLTVEDSDHLTDSTDAHIIVQKEVDYAPQANAGEDVVVYLPNSAVTLYGNASTDDKGIVSYEWTKAPGSEDKAVDMQDTHKPFLHLSNLEEGVYSFMLKVTDSAEHTSTDTVVVLVKAQANTPPQAVVGKNQTLTLPRTWAALDGSASHDNLRVTSWLWEQVSGPARAHIVNATRPVANATGLTRGAYVFRLTVCDDASNSTALANVTVVQATNQPPVADAGGDLTLHLPVSVVTLNGSRSSDDVAIVGWQWRRDGSSLAAGRVVGDTDTARSLQLVDMVAGTYRFQLTVTDEQGAVAHDTVSVVIQDDPHISSQIRMELDVPFSQWTQAQQEALLHKMELLVPSSGTVQVRLLRWMAEPYSGHLLLELTARETTLGEDAKPQHKMLPGLSVVEAVRSHLRSDPSALGHPLLRVDTVTCQNSCSGHGRCDEATRACVCDRFWMENVFRKIGSEGEANCDWSVLYVIIIAFSLAVSAGVAVWAAVCLLRRWWGGGQRARRPRYAPVDDPENFHMLPKNGHSASSMMASETDSESEPLFEAMPGRRRAARNNNKRRKRNGTARPAKGGKKM